MNFILPQFNIRNLLFSWIYVMLYYYRIKILKCTAVFWQLEFFGRGVRESVGRDLQNRTLYWVTLWLFYVDRLGETSENRLLWLWKKAAMMLDWGNSTLDITTAGIVGISYCCMVLCIALCWGWQCLLTVRGNLLPYFVTPLDVTTVAWLYRQTQDILHPTECPTAALQTSKWQWTASVFAVWRCSESSCSLFTADKYH